MKSQHPIWRGALILTAAGFASRFIGFFYRIFLSNAIGAEGMGLYQLVFPVYAMMISFTTAGIQTAVSRHVSARAAAGNRRDAREILFAGLSVSLALSLAAAFLVSAGSGFLAEHFLFELRCAPLLRLAAWAVPFGCIHACLAGYYIGLQRTDIPALSQLAEQLVRVTASWLIFCVLLEQGIAPGPILAVGGMLAAELVSSLFTGTIFLFMEVPQGLSIRRHSHTENSHASRARGPRLPRKKAYHSVLSMAAPLTGTRVIMNFLHSAQAALLPVTLQAHGLTSSQALSQYGILTGMAMPLIMFPSAIANGLSTMLLPSVSEDLSLNRPDHIRQTVESTVSTSLWLGIFCTGGFLLTGKELGVVLFGSPEAAPFIQTLAWLCPFLYLDTTLSSILHGLGRLKETFFLNAGGHILQLAFTLLAVPRFGIAAYLWGILASQLLSAFLALFLVYRYTAFSFHVMDWTVKPLLSIVISAGIYRFWNGLLSRLPFSVPSLVGMLISGLTMSLTFFFFMYLSFRPAQKTQPPRPGKASAETSAPCE